MELPHPAANVGSGPAAAVPPVAKTNTMAILSLVFAFVAAPLGLVFGMVARRQIRRTGEQGRGLALAGMILSGLALVGVFAAVAVAALGMNSAGDAMVRATMESDARSMASVQDVYLTAHPDKAGFPVSLTADQSVDIAGVSYQAAHGNAVAVKTSDKGFCVIVTNAAVDAPVRYDSVKNVILPDGSAGEGACVGS